MAKKYTEAQDEAYDRKRGIKEGSKRDNALDKKRGLPPDRQRQMFKKGKSRGR